MACRDRVLDVFVTKSDKDPRDHNENYHFDDTFVGSFMSVDFTETAPTQARIVDYATEWIITSWPASEVHSRVSQPTSGLKKGDLIRIGGVSTEGFTDWLTILEAKPDVASFYNATSATIPLSLPASSFPSRHVVDVEGLVVPDAATYDQATGAPNKDDPRSIHFVHTLRMYPRKDYIGLTFWTSIDSTSVVPWPTIDELSDHIPHVGDVWELSGSLELDQASGAVFNSAGFPPGLYPVKHVMHNVSIDETIPGFESKGTCHIAIIQSKNGIIALDGLRDSLDYFFTSSVPYCFGSTRPMYLSLLPHHSTCCIPIRLLRLRCVLGMILKMRGGRSSWTKSAA